MSTDTTVNKKPRGRRPSKGPKRNQNMLIKLTETEKARLWDTALSYEMTLSEFVRAACRDICDNGFSKPVRKA